jgi:hypothetical protein
MRRKAWLMIRNGVMAPCFYVQDTEPTPEQFADPEQVQIAGPVNIEAPPPPTDFVGMDYTIWTWKLGYVHQAGPDPLSN